MGRPVAHTHNFTHACTQVHTQARTHTHTHTQTYIHTPSHTLAHTYTHAHTQACSCMGESSPRAAQLLSGQRRCWAGHEARLCGWEGKGGGSAAGCGRGLGLELGQGSLRMGIHVLCYLSRRGHACIEKSSEVTQVVCHMCCPAGR